jgi:hypothetical protein
MPPVDRRRAPATWMQRLVLLVALLAFAVPAVAAPFGHLCLCFHGETPVAVGGCCCDAAPARAAVASEPDHAAPDSGSALRDDPACHGDRCDCVDLTSPGDPFASVAHRADPLPSPELIAHAALSPVSVLSVAGLAFRASLPPPDPPGPPPLRLRVLRC